LIMKFFYEVNSKKNIRVISWKMKCYSTKI
jgi:hypothetical protein